MDDPNQARFWSHVLRSGIDSYQSPEETENFISSTIDSSLSLPLSPPSISSHQFTLQEQLHAYQELLHATSGEKASEISLPAGQEPTSLPRNAQQPSPQQLLSVSSINALVQPYVAPRMQFPYELWRATDPKLMRPNSSNMEKILSNNALHYPMQPFFSSVSAFSQPQVQDTDGNSAIIPLVPSANILSAPSSLANYKNSSSQETTTRGSSISQSTSSTRLIITNPYLASIYPFQTGASLVIQPMTLPKATQFITNPWAIPRIATCVLLLCIRISVDPPDVVRLPDSSRMISFIPIEASADSLQTGHQIAEHLHNSISTLKSPSPLHLRSVLDPTRQLVIQSMAQARKHAGNERVLVWINGHGVPVPTKNAEIWVYNTDYTQYVPLSLKDVIHTIGPFSPSLFVLDMHKAELVIDRYFYLLQMRVQSAKKAIAQHQQLLEQLFAYDKIVEQHDKAAHDQRQSTSTNASTTPSVKAASLSSSVPANAEPSMTSDTQSSQLRDGSDTQQSVQSTLPHRPSRLGGTVRTSVGGQGVMMMTSNPNANARRASLLSTGQHQQPNQVSQLPQLPRRSRLGQHQGLAGVDPVLGSKSSALSSLGSPQLSSPLSPPSNHNQDVRLPPPPFDGEQLQYLRSLQQQYIDLQTMSEFTHIFIGSCSQDELLPFTQGYPQDLLTSTLTHPVKMLLLHHYNHYYRKDVDYSPRTRLASHQHLSGKGATPQPPPGYHGAHIHVKDRHSNSRYRDAITPFMGDNHLSISDFDRIPGLDKPTSRAKVYGSLVWFLTSTTDTIAWSTFSPMQFNALFRRDTVLSSIFRNYLLAQRICHDLSITTVTYPPLPSANNHPLWRSLDSYVDKVVLQLFFFITKSIPPVLPDFFQQFLTMIQLTLFSHTTNKRPPMSLAMLLQMLLAPKLIRVEALRTLAVYMAKHPINNITSLIIGVLPYIRKIVESVDFTQPSAVLSTRLLNNAIVLVWLRIVTVDRDSIRQIETPKIVTSFASRFIALSPDFYLPPFEIPVGLIHYDPTQAGHAPSHMEAFLPFFDDQFKPPLSPHQNQSHMDSVNQQFLQHYGESPPIPSSSKASAISGASPGLLSPLPQQHSHVPSLGDPSSQKQVKLIYDTNDSAFIRRQMTLDSQLVGYKHRQQQRLGISTAINQALDTVTEPLRYYPLSPHHFPQNDCERSSAPQLTPAGHPLLSGGGSLNLQTYSTTFARTNVSGTTMYELYQPTLLSRHEHRLFTPPNHLEPSAPQYYTQALPLSEAVEYSQQELMFPYLDGEIVDDLDTNHGTDLLDDYFSSSSHPPSKYNYDDEPGRYYFTLQDYHDTQYRQLQVSLVNSDLSLSSNLAHGTKTYYRRAQLLISEEKKNNSMLYNLFWGSDASLDNVQSRPDHMYASTDRQSNYHEFAHRANITQSTNTISAMYNRLHFPLNYSSVSAALMPSISPNYDAQQFDNRSLTKIQKQLVSKESITPLLETSLPDCTQLLAHTIDGLVTQQMATILLLSLLSISSVNRIHQQQMQYLHQALEVEKPLSQNPTIYELRTHTPPISLSDKAVPANVISASANALAIAQLRHLNCQQTAILLTSPPPTTMEEERLASGQPLADILSATYLPEPPKPPATTTATKRDSVRTPRSSVKKATARAQSPDLQLGDTQRTLNPTGDQARPEAAVDLDHRSLPSSDAPSVELKRGPSKLSTPHMSASLKNSPPHPSMTPPRAHNTRSDSASHAASGSTHDENGIIRDDIDLSSHDDIFSSLFPVHNHMNRYQSYFLVIQNTHMPALFRFLHLSQRILFSPTQWATIKCMMSLYSSDITKPSHNDSKPPVNYGSTLSIPLSLRADEIFHLHLVQHYIHTVDTPVISPAVHTADSCDNPNSLRSFAKPILVSLLQPMNTQITIYNTVNFAIFQSHADPTLDGLSSGVHSSLSHFSSSSSSSSSDEIHSQIASSSMKVDASQHLHSASSNYAHHPTFISPLSSFNTTPASVSPSNHQHHVEGMSAIEEEGVPLQGKSPFHKSSLTPTYSSQKPSGQGGLGNLSFSHLPGVSSPAFSSTSSSSSHDIVVEPSSEELYQDHISQHFPFKPYVFHRFPPLLDALHLYIRSPSLHIVSSSLVFLASLLVHNLTSQNFCLLSNLHLHVLSLCAPQFRWFRFVGGTMLPPLLLPLLPNATVSSLQHALSFDNTLKCSSRTHGYKARSDGGDPLFPDQDELVFPHPIPPPPFCHSFNLIGSPHSSPIVRSCALHALTQLFTTSPPPPDPSCVPSPSQSVSTATPRRSSTKSNDRTSSEKSDTTTIHSASRQNRRDRQENAQPRQLMASDYFSPAISTATPTPTPSPFFHPLTPSFLTGRNSGIFPSTLSVSGGDGDDSRYFFGISSDALPSSVNACGKEPSDSQPQPIAPVVLPFVPHQQQALSDIPALERDYELLMTAYYAVQANYADINIQVRSSTALLLASVLSRFSSLFVVLLIMQHQPLLAEQIKSVRLGSLITCHFASESSQIETPGHLPIFPTVSVGYDRVYDPHSILLMSMTDTPPHPSPQPPNSSKGSHESIFPASADTHSGTQTHHDDLSTVQVFPFMTPITEQHHCLFYCEFLWSVAQNMMNDPKPAVTTPVEQQVALIRHLASVVDHKVMNNTIQQIAQCQRLIISPDSQPSQATGQSGGGVTQGTGDPTQLRKTSLTGKMNNIRTFHSLSQSKSSADQSLQLSSSALPPTTPTPLRVQKSSKIVSLLNYNSSLTTLPIITTQLYRYNVPLLPQLNRVLPPSILSIRPHHPASPTNTPAYLSLLSMNNHFNRLYFFDMNLFEHVLSTFSTNSYTASSILGNSFRGVSATNIAPNEDLSTSAQKRRIAYNSQATKHPTGRSSHSRSMPVRSSIPSMAKGSKSDDKFGQLSGDILIDVTAKSNANNGLLPFDSPTPSIPDPLELYTAPASQLRPLTSLIQQDFAKVISTSALTGDHSHNTIALLTTQNARYHHFLQKLHVKHMTAHTHKIHDFNRYMQLKTLLSADQVSPQVHLETHKRNRDATAIDNTMSTIAKWESEFFSSLFEGSNCPHNLHGCGCDSHLNWHRYHYPYHYQIYEQYVHEQQLKHAEAQPRTQQAYGDGGYFTLNADGIVVYFLNSYSPTDDQLQYQHPTHHHDNMLILPQDSTVSSTQSSIASSPHQPVLIKGASPTMVASSPSSLVSSTLSSSHDVFSDYSSTASSSEDGSTINHALDNMGFSAVNTLVRSFSSSTLQRSSTPIAHAVDPQQKPRAVHTNLVTPTLTPQISILSNVHTFRGNDYDNYVAPHQYLHPPSFITNTNSSSPSSSFASSPSTGPSQLTPTTSPTPHLVRAHSLVSPLTSTLSPKISNHSAIPSSPRSISGGLLNHRLLVPTTTLQRDTTFLHYSGITGTPVAGISPDGQRDLGDASSMKSGDSIIIPVNVPRNVIDMYSDFFKLGIAVARVLLHAPYCNTKGRIWGLLHTSVIQKMGKICCWREFLDIAVETSTEDAKHHLNQPVGKRGLQTHISTSVAKEDHQLKKMRRMFLHTMKNAAEPSPLARNNPTDCGDEDEDDSWEDSTDPTPRTSMDDDSYDDDDDDDISSESDDSSIAPSNTGNPHQSFQTNSGRKPHSRKDMLKKNKLRHRDTLSRNIVIEFFAGIASVNHILLETIFYAIDHLHVERQSRLRRYCPCFNLPSITSPIYPTPSIPIPVLSSSHAVVPNEDRHAKHTLSGRQKAILSTDGPIYHHHHRGGALNSTTNHVDELYIQRNTLNIMTPISNHPQQVSFVKFGTLPSVASTVKTHQTSSTHGDTIVELNSPFSSAVSDDFVYYYEISYALASMARNLPQCHHICTCDCTCGPHLGVPVGRKTVEDDISGNDTQFRQSMTSTSRDEATLMDSDCKLNLKKHTLLYEPLYYLYNNGNTDFSSLFYFSLNNADNSYFSCCHYHARRIFALKQHVVTNIYRSYPLLSVDLSVGPGVTRTHSATTVSLPLLTPDASNRYLTLFQQQYPRQVLPQLNMPSSYLSSPLNLLNKGVLAQWSRDRSRLIKRRQLQLLRRLYVPFTQFMNYNTNTSDGAATTMYPTSVVSADDFRQVLTTMMNIPELADIILGSPSPHGNSINYASAAFTLGGVKTPSTASSIGREGDDIALDEDAPISITSGTMFPCQVISSSLLSFTQQKPPQVGNAAERTTSTPPATSTTTSRNHSQHGVGVSLELYPPPLKAHLENMSNVTSRQAKEISVREKRKRPNLIEIAQLPIPRQFSSLTVSLAASVPVASGDSRSQPPSQASQANIKSAQSSSDAVSQQKRQGAHAAGTSGTVGDQQSSTRTLRVQQTFHSHQFSPLLTQLLESGFVSSRRPLSADVMLTSARASLLPRTGGTRGEAGISASNSSSSQSTSVGPHATPFEGDTPPLPKSITPLLYPLPSQRLHCVFHPFLPLLSIVTPQQVILTCNIEKIYRGGSLQPEWVMLNPNTFAPTVFSQHPITLGSLLSAAAATSQPSAASSGNTTTSETGDAPTTTTGSQPSTMPDPIHTKLNYISHLSVINNFTSIPTVLVATSNDRMIRVIQHYHSAYPYLLHSFCAFDTKSSIHIEQSRRDRGVWIGNDNLMAPSSRPSTSSPNAWLSASSTDSPSSTSPPHERRELSHAMAVQGGSSFTSPLNTLGYAASMSNVIPMSLGYLSGSVEHQRQPQLPSWYNRLSYASSIPSSLVDQMTQVARMPLVVPTAVHESPTDTGDIHQLFQVFESLDHSVLERERIISLSRNSFLPQQALLNSQQHLQVQQQPQDHLTSSLLLTLSNLEQTSAPLYDYHWMQVPKVSSGTPTAVTHSTAITGSHSSRQVNQQYSTPIGVWQYSSLTNTVSLSNEQVVKPLQQMDRYTRASTRLLQNIEALPRNDLFEFAHEQFTGGYSFNAPVNVMQVVSSLQDCVVHNAVHYELTQAALHESTSLQVAADTMASETQFAMSPDSGIKDSRASYPSSITHSLPDPVYTTAVETSSPTLHHQPQVFNPQKHPQQRQRWANAKRVSRSIEYEYLTSAPLVVTLDDNFLYASVNYTKVWDINKSICVSEYNFLNNHYGGVIENMLGFQLYHSHHASSPLGSILRRSNLGQSLAPGLSLFDVNSITSLSPSPVVASASTVSQSVLYVGNNSGSVTMVDTRVKPQDSWIGGIQLDSGSHNVNTNLSINNIQVIGDYLFVSQENSLETTGVSVLELIGQYQQQKRLSHTLLEHNTNAIIHQLYSTGFSSPMVSQTQTPDAEAMYNILDEDQYDWDNDAWLEESLWNEVCYQQQQHHQKQQHEKLLQEQRKIREKHRRWWARQQKQVSKTKGKSQATSGSRLAPSQATPSSAHPSSGPISQGPDQPHGHLANSHRYPSTQSAGLSSRATSQHAGLHSSKPIPPTPLKSAKGAGVAHHQERSLPSPQANPQTVISDMKKSHQPTSPLQVIHSPKFSLYDAVKTHQLHIKQQFAAFTKTDYFTHPTKNAMSPSSTAPLTVSTLSSNRTLPLFHTLPSVSLLLSLYMTLREVVTTFMASQHSETYKKQLQHLLSFKRDQTPPSSTPLQTDQESSSPSGSQSDYRGPSIPLTVSSSASSFNGSFFTDSTSSSGDLESRRASPFTLPLALFMVASGVRSTSALVAQTNTTSDDNSSSIPMRFQSDSSQHSTQTGDLPTSLHSPAINATTVSSYQQQPQMPSSSQDNKAPASRPYLSDTASQQPQKHRFAGDHPDHHLNEPTYTLVPFAQQLSAHHFLKTSTSGQQSGVSMSNGASSTNAPGQGHSTSSTPIPPLTGQNSTTDSNLNPGAVACTSTVHPITAWVACGTINSPTLHIFTPNQMQKPHQTIKYHASFVSQRIQSSLGIQWHPLQPVLAVLGPDYVTLYVDANYSLSASHSSTDFE